jgi:hypothetical protein
MRRCGSQGRTYRGRFGDDQLRFVANVLRNVPPEDLVVVSMHIPLTSFDDPDSAPDNTVDRSALLKLLANRPHTLSFAGHSHTTEYHYFGDREGFSRDVPHHHHVLTAACGSWWSGPPDVSGVPIADSRDGTLKGFHVLSVDGNRYTTASFRSAPLPIPMCAFPSMTGTRPRGPHCLWSLQRRPADARDLRDRWQTRFRHRA